MFEVPDPHLARVESGPLSFQAEACAEAGMMIMMMMMLMIILYSNLTECSIKTSRFRLLFSLLDIEVIKR